MKRVFVVLAGLWCLSAPAFSDRVETGHVGVRQPAANGGASFSSWLKGAKPEKRKAVTKKIRPIKLKKKTKRRTAKRKRGKPVVLSQPPVVLSELPVTKAFRDCVVAQVVEYSGQSQSSDVAAMVVRSMRDTCTAERDALVAELSSRSNGAGQPAVSKLIDDIFIPAVIEAVAKARTLPTTRETAVVPATLGQTVTPVAAVPKPAAGVQAVNPLAERNMKQAKSKMFQCFKRRADRLAGDLSKKASEVADSVVRECDPQTNTFFSLLHRMFHASAEEQQIRKQAAIAQTYQPAIARRVEILRRKSRSRQPTAVLRELLPN